MTLKSNKAVNRLGKMLDAKSRKTDLAEFAWAQNKRAFRVLRRPWCWCLILVHKTVNESYSMIEAIFRCCYDFHVIREKFI